MSLAAGTLGRYQIIREIARSNDIVYEAWDPVLNRRVALKELVIPPSATPTQAEDRIRRFEREARAAGALTHPNIVTIYEVGCDGGRHFLAMEYLEGESLRQQLDGVGALGEAEAIRIISQVLEGLAHAHDKGIVHRDIKPDNIHILPDGRVKITDLGIARLTYEPKLTVTGQIFGTPSYMSPEQVHGEDIDVRSDVWSVGVVLYEAICGAKPFVGSSVIGIAHSVLHDQPPDPPGASYGVTELIRTALNKSPDARFANAGVMLRALENISRQPFSQPVQQRAGTAYSASPQQPGANLATPPQQVFSPPQTASQPVGSFSVLGWVAAGLLALVVIVMANNYTSRTQGNENPIPPAEAPRESASREPTHARESAPITSPHEDMEEDSPFRSRDNVERRTNQSSIVPTESEVLDLLKKWEEAQDRRDMASYSKLYSSSFWGIRRTYRSNKTQVVYQGGYHEWMKDRERMMRSAAIMDVNLYDVELSLVDEEVLVRFIQTYETINARTGKRWADQGKKVMTIRREGNECKITSEELLYSTPY